MGQVKLAIFDLDGTLINTYEGLEASLLFTLDQYGFPCPSKEERSTFFGPPMQFSLMRYYGIGEEEAWTMANTFRTRYIEADIVRSKPYEGILPMLERVKNAGILCAVATNKREDHAIRLMEDFGFKKYLNGGIYGLDFYSRLKKEGLIRNCMRDNGIEDKERALLIGDTIYDLDAAQKADIDLLAVTWGFGYRKENGPFEGTIGFVNTPNEAAEFIIDRH